MKKSLFFRSTITITIIIISMLSSCNQKQTDEEAANIKSTDIENASDSEDKTNTDLSKDIEEDIEEDSTVKSDPLVTDQVERYERPNSNEFNPPNYELKQVFEEIELSEPLHLT